MKRLAPQSASAKARQNFLPILEEVIKRSFASEREERAVIERFGELVEQFGAPFLVAAGCSVTLMQNWKEDREAIRRTHEALALEDTESPILICITADAVLVAHRVRCTNGAWRKRLGTSIPATNTRKCPGRADAPTCEFWLQL